MIAAQHATALPPSCISWSSHRHTIVKCFLCNFARLRPFAVQCGKEISLASDKMTRRSSEGGATLAPWGLVSRSHLVMMLSNRRSTFGITCVQCHEELIAPDKSEYCAGAHIRHLWHCSSCSTRFESIEQIPVGAMTSDDIFLSAVAA